MKKVLSTILALVSSMMLNAQVVDSSALDSIKAQFEFERGEKVDSFNIEVEKAYREYEEYERKLHSEYAKYQTAIKQTWGADNALDDTPNEWVEYSKDFKSRSVVDFEKGNISIEIALDDVDKENTEEIERRLTKAIEELLESKGSTNPYSRQQGIGLTKEPILNGLVDLSRYDIEKSAVSESPTTGKKGKKAPPTPTIKGQELKSNAKPKEQAATTAKQSTMQNVGNDRITERQKELEKKREQEANRIAAVKKKEQEAKQQAEKKKKQAQEKEQLKAEEKKIEEEEKARLQAEEKKKQAQEKEQLKAEEKKIEEKEEKARLQAEEKKRQQEASANDIAKAVAQQSEKTITTIKGEDNQQRTVVKVNMALVSDNLSKNASLYKDYVTKYSGDFSIEEPLIFAVIEQESSFNPEAKSWVPAYGLMQLVPKSGGFDAYRYVYKREWIPTMSYLYVPHQNIELGTAYLRILMNQFKNVKDPDCRRLCAIAGYNTGAGNVCRAFTGKTNISGAVEMINKLSYDELYEYLTNKLSTDEARKYVSGVSKRREKYMKKEE